MKKFDHLMIVGRPASGKSEFIDFIKNLPDSKRLEDFHIAKIDELDDFPWIYAKFKEDDVWEKCGYPRLYSKKAGDKVYDTSDYSLYDHMIGKLNDEIEKKYLPRTDFYKNGTLFVEFARGQSDAYAKAFKFFTPEVLKRTAIINIYVSFEESVRRNFARATENCEQGVLKHIVPRNVIEGYYRENDWDEFTGKRHDGYLDIKGVKVPFVTMNNEPELKDATALVSRYKNSLDTLIELYERR